MARAGALLCSVRGHCRGPQRQAAAGGSGEAQSTPAVPRQARACGGSAHACRAPHATPWTPRLTRGALSCAPPAPWSRRACRLR